MNETCCFCGKERDGKWALLFSPPKKNKVTKHHICPECYAMLHQRNKEAKT